MRTRAEPWLYLRRGGGANMAKLNHMWPGLWCNILCSAQLVCVSWPGPAHPDGGVDAAAPPAHPAAHVRLPLGATQRGRAWIEGRGPSAGCPSWRPQSEHTQRSKLRLPKYVLAERFPHPAPRVTSWDRGNLLKGYPFLGLCLKFAYP